MQYCSKYKITVSFKNLSWLIRKAKRKAGITTKELAIKSGISYWPLTRAEWHGDFTRDNLDKLFTALHHYMTVEDKYKIASALNDDELWGT